MTFTHDRLQQQCFQYLHNTYPELRKLFWAVINETKPIPGETSKSVAIRANRLKSIGLVPGVYDFHFFYAGCLHCFDFKVGRDVLSSLQLQFKAQIENQGGKCYEIRSEEQFANIIAGIIS